MASKIWEAALSLEKLVLWSCVLAFGGAPLGYFWSLELGLNLSRVTKWLSTFNWHLISTVETRVVGDIVTIPIRFASHVYKIKSARFMEDIPRNSEADIDYNLEVLVGLELLQNIFLGILSEVLSLNFDELVQVILQLAIPQLF